MCSRKKERQAQTKSHQLIEPFNSQIVELHKNHNEFLIKGHYPSY